MKLTRSAVYLVFVMPIAQGFFSGACQAEVSLHSGQYIAAGGQGRLTIGNTQAGKTAFSMEIDGANGHSCSYEGGIGAGKAKNLAPMTPRNSVSLISRFPILVSR